jgi:hypothetical protein
VPDDLPHYSENAVEVGGRDLPSRAFRPGQGSKDEVGLALDGYDVTSES